MMKIFGIFLLLMQCFMFADSVAKTDSKGKKQVYIVHGFAANANKHWFNWLKTELEKDKNISVKVLNMPNSEAPNLQEWLNTLKKEAGKVDENTYFVGHSLGCITILRYLSSLDSKNALKIGGVVLVSGFYEKLKILPQLDSFVSVPLDFERLSKVINERFVISARDDEIVPTTLSNNLADKLQATFIQTPKGKHFMDREGVTTMPLVLFLLQNLFNNKGF